MKFTCPRCGRTFDIDEDIGDFPVRCHRCTALLRRRSSDTPSSGPQSLIQAILNPGRPRAHAAADGNLRRGMLADMLGARPAFDEREPSIIHAHAQPPTTQEPAAPPEHPVLTHETRRVARQVRTRQQRIRRALLQGSQRALGTLGWVGLIIVTLLSIGILVLQAQAASHH